MSYVINHFNDVYAYSPALLLLLHAKCLTREQRLKIASREIENLRWVIIAGMIPKLNWQTIAPLARPSKTSEDF